MQNEESLILSSFYLDRKISFDSSVSGRVNNKCLKNIMIGSKYFHWEPKLFSWPAYVRVLVSMARIVAVVHHLDDQSSEWIVGKPRVAWTGHHPQPVWSTMVHTEEQLFGQLGHSRHRDTVASWSNTTLSSAVIRRFGDTGQPMQAPNTTTNNQ